MNEKILRSQYTADNIGQTSTSSSQTSNTNPLDSNKTIPNSSNNHSSNQTASSNDEPNMKMAKLQTNLPATKKNDKKKALKRL